MRALRAARCDAAVLDTIARMALYTLVEGCVSTRKVPNPRGLGLITLAGLFGSETITLLDKFGIIKLERDSPVRSLALKDYYVTFLKRGEENLPR